MTDAVNRISDSLTPVNVVGIDLDHALYCVLAQPIFSPTDLPAFTNSSMDGFAVKAIDTSTASKTKSVSLDIISKIPAGARLPKIELKSGQAAQIMTGARLPFGADSVVPVEMTNHSFISKDIEQENIVEVFSEVRQGDFIRKQGEDIKKGELVLEPGNRLRPQELGFLAMLGISKVDVYRKPRIAILSTGDELLPINAQPEPGKIYDANSFSLGSLVRQNHCDLLQLEIVGDNLKAIENQLDFAVKNDVDMIITSAGVSVGEYDFVRELIENKGELEFWRINMRPGKPLAFGLYKNIPFIGLPGNPVSAFVGFEVVVRPGILKLCGLKKIRRPTIKVKVKEPIESDGRESYLRAKIWQEDGLFYAKPIHNQGSGNLYSLILANAFLIVPSEVKSLPIDAELDAWFLEDKFIF